GRAGRRAGSDPGRIPSNGGAGGGARSRAEASREARGPGHLPFGAPRGFAPPPLRPVALPPVPCVVPRSVQPAVSAGAVRPLWWRALPARGRYPGDGRAPPASVLRTDDPGDRSLSPAWRAG